MTSKLTGKDTTTTTFFFFFTSVERSQVLIVLVLIPGCSPTSNGNVLKQLIPIVRRHGRFRSRNLLRPYVRFSKDSRGRDISFYIRVNVTMKQCIRSTSIVFFTRFSYLKLRNTELPS